MSAVPIAHGNRILTTPCVRVASGEHYSAALTQSGELFSWGRGDSGQLGYALSAEDRAGTASSVPRRVPLPEAVVSVSLGWDHACCVTVQGALYSWGAGTFGQLGHGDAAGRAAPARVEALEDTAVSQVACGWSFTLCVTDESSVYSWGAAAAGQLGHPSTRRRRSPVAVAALADTPVPRMIDPSSVLRALHHEMSMRCVVATGFCRLIGFIMCVIGVQ